MCCAAASSSERGHLATRRGCIARPGIPSLPVAVIEGADALDAPPRCVPVLPLAGLPDTVAVGRVSAEAGRAAADCVRWAARAALRGGGCTGYGAVAQRGAVCRRRGLPGHTELLQAEAAAHQGVALDAMPVRMMLASDELRTVLVSIHVSPARCDCCCDRGQRAADRADRACGTAAHPGACAAHRCGRAQPHAGEGGLFGREELEIIAPALAQLRAQGWMCTDRCRRIPSSCGLGTPRPIPVSLMS